MWRGAVDKGSNMMRLENWAVRAVNGQLGRTVALQVNECEVEMSAAAARLLGEALQVRAGEAEFGPSERGAANS